jgi:dethiobiotin synthetase
MVTTSLPRHLFVTGTDTGVGKTTVTEHLIQQFVALGLKVVGMKPVASGCEWLDGRWQGPAGTGEPLLFSTGHRATPGG